MSIVNYNDTTFNIKRIDNSGNTLTLGANTTGMTIGNTGGTTFIQGNVQFGGQAGATGQYLKSNGPSTVPTWDTPSSSTWVGTATSDLNMGNTYNIISAKSIDNNAGILTIGANVSTLNIGNSGLVTAIKGSITMSGDLKLNTAGILACSSIDNSGNALTIGATTTGMTIGNTSSTNTINGSGVIGGITCFNNAMAGCSQINNTASTDLALGNTQVAGVLNLGTGATRTGNINLGASGWATGVVNTYRPIAPQYTPVVAGSSPAATTTPGPGQIGYTISYTALQNTANFGATPAQVIQQYTNVIDKGIWHCSVSLGLDLTSAGGGTWFSYRVSIVNQTAGSVTLANSCNQTPGITLGFAYNNLSTQCVSAIIVANGLTSIRIIPELVYSSGTFRPSADNYVLFFTKIA